MTHERSIHEEMLRHRQHLRRLARALIALPDAAEDALQETYAITLERRPKGDLRAWMSTTLRRAVAHGRRSNARRAVRERMAARQEASDRDAVEELSTQRSLLEAVEGLPEPYRTVVVQRFYRERSTAQLAVDLEVAEATVRTRLHRGLKLLRERLNQGSGESESRAGLLLLAGSAPKSVLTPAVGVTLMSIKSPLVVALGSTLLAVGVWTWLRSPDPEAPGSKGVEAGEVSMASVDPGSPEESRVVVSVPSVRSEVESEEPRVVVPEAPLTPIGHGLVIDLEGQPVAEVTVTTDDGSDAKWESRSDLEGRFPVFEVGDFGFEVQGQGWCTLGVGVQQAAETDPCPIVVVAKPVDYVGRVLESDGRPSAGARVYHWIPQAWNAGIELDLDSSRWDPRSVITDADGAFELRGVPSIEIANLNARSTDQTRQVQIDADPAGAVDLELVLSPPWIPMEPLRGVVVDPSGTPAPKAQVSIVDDWNCTTSDGEGAFELDWKLIPKGSVLRAVARGYAPSEAIPVPVALDPDPDRNPILTVRLGPPSLGIEGVVRDTDGTPLEGIDVTFSNQEVFGMVVGGWRSTVEDLARIPAEHRPRTDAQGRFVLTGLQDRAYGLVAVHPDDLRRIELDGVRPSEQIVDLRFPDLEPYELQGLCLDETGNPLAGVRVVAGREGARASSESERGSIWMTDEVESDPQGRFSIHVQCGALDYLEAYGPEVIPLQRYLEAPSTDEPLQLIFSRRCHLRVELSPQWSRCTHCRVYDAEDNELWVHHFESDFTGRQPNAYVNNGRTGTFVVRPRAATLVLFEDETPLHRQPIHPVPGEVTTVQVD